MSNGFIPVAIAHDSTCKPGEEWLFHGTAKPYDVHGSLESPLDENLKNLLDDDMNEMKKHYDEENAIPEDWECNDDFSWCGCLVSVAFILTVVGLVVWKFCF